MADSKVSELTSATSVGGSDLLYLVQSGTSKKVTAATLFGNAANVTLKGNINLDSTVQLLASPGIIDLTKPITHLAADASGGNCSIPTGTAGQVKIVCLISTAGGMMHIRGNIANNANVEFSTAGDTATMLYTNNKWFVIGGSAAVDNT
jgi:hypothetical protein